MRKLFLAIVLLTIVTNLFGQSKISRQEYISRYADIAIRQMKQYGVPASIILAQGMLESDNGNSTLAEEANNHFGIKCHKDWTGPTMYHDDDRKNECFRKYKSPDGSYMDHSLFLRGGSRYAFLFDLESTDYTGWAHGLKKAGYATNPRYAEMLIKIIEENELYKYDKGVVVSVESPRKGTGQLVDVDGFTIDIYKTRPVYTRNRIKYIIVKEGDTFESLTKELSLMPWQLYKYNDLSKDSTLRVGQEIYIQPKRWRAERNHSVHTVEAGETMYTISQMYGVKLKSLYRKNRMKVSEEPEVGQTINLRKRKH
ncbi:N-acetylmuramoyl-L-alanine amidase [Tenuifilaceae bacterium CYCD]|nr:N-acetylmuramoyl-L-alanine amidase [Tenuifilaceae bacterium CYCD]